MLIHDFYTTKMVHVQQVKKLKVFVQVKFSVVNFMC